jgi:PAS domain S-box-containing protein
MIRQFQGVDVAWLERSGRNGDAAVRKHGAYVRPTGTERRFAVDDVIVTKTDLKGVITYANPVFLEISLLTERQAIGAPHSIIRHPEMPRVIFKMLWDTISSGEEIFAYVLNMASNGDHYWVFAHVTPTFAADGSIIGYHSNRRVPEPKALEAIIPLYAELKATEERASSKAQGLVDSTAAVSRLLQSKSTTYAEFIFSLAR